MAQAVTRRARPRSRNGGDPADQARKTAEQQAIAVTVAADAEKKAAADRAEAVGRRRSRRAAEKIAAEAAAQAEKFRAEGSALLPAPKRRESAVNEASNTLSAEQTR
jgi:hypothetical protein